MKNLAVIGCSYTHWQDSNNLFDTYPFYISEYFKDYNVYDLSHPGGGNSTAYLRLKWLENYYNITIDKVLFQITHFYRLFIHSNERYLLELKEPLFEKIFYLKNNYWYTSGIFNKYYGFHVTPSLRKGKILEVENRYKIDNCYKVIAEDLLSWRGEWETQQQIDLLDSKYDCKFLSWYCKDDNHLQKIMKNNNNYLGRACEYMGKETFENLGKENEFHFGKEGHTILFSALLPKLKKWL